MYIRLANARPDTLEKLYNTIEEADPDGIIDTQDSEDHGLYVPGSGRHVVLNWTGLDDDLPRPFRRWRELRLASLGCRVWSNQEIKHSPVYMGKLPETPKDFARVVADAQFAEGKAALFAGFGVSYIGRTSMDPRAVLVVDNKRNNPEHSPLYSEELEKLYGVLPEQWWQSFSVVSTGNVEKLDAFLEMLSESLPIAYSSGGKAKLRFLGRDFREIGHPTDDRNYGFSLQRTVDTAKITFN